MPESDTSSEANRLYWDTEESVAEIAQRLDLSRRALYQVIEPVATGTFCDVCGGPLVFENRSARTAGDATCPVCAETGAAAADQPPEPEPDVDAEDHALVVGGAALAGAALGALLTLAVVPRR
jgi:hypothetical protein